MPSYVIAGASLAGAKAAETLRDEGFDGDIVLIGAEAERPYERPPLSKGYLLGSDARDSVYVHAAEWYAEHGVDLREGVTVTAIDRGARTVATSSGAQVSYDKLLLATGASPRRLDFPGSDREEVLYLRTIADSDRLRSAFQPGTRVVVAGAGWIGLETAAAARTAECTVTVLEPQPGALHDQLGPELGAVFAELHRAHGVEFLIGGPAAARSMLGQAVRYDQVPYFYSDQYDLGMECAGLPSPGSYDQILYRGDPGTREFVAFWLSGGAVIAGMNVNVWDVNDDIQTLIRAARPVDPARLTNPDIPLTDL